MFPLSLKLQVSLLEEEQAAMQKDGVSQTEEGSSFTGCHYSATVLVFSTISGLITVRSDGTICGIKDSFALMLFGYEKEELLGKVRQEFESLPKACSVWQHIHWNCTVIFHTHFCLSQNLRVPCVWQVSCRMIHKFPCCNCEFSQC